MATVRQQPANGDICAVLEQLLDARRFDIGRAAANADAMPDASTPDAEFLDTATLDTATLDAATLDAFRLDHAHHADRLPLLLRELASPRAA